MPAGITPQTTTKSLTEATSAAASGVAGGATNQIDLAVLYSQLINATVARQIMAIGDPLNVFGVAEVGNLVTDGSDQSLSVKLSPGSPELQQLISEMRMLRAEMQQIVVALGSIPATGVPLIETNN